MFWACNSEHLVLGSDGCRVRTSIIHEIRVCRGRGPIEMVNLRLENAMFCSMDEEEYIVYFHDVTARKYGRSFERRFSTSFPPQYMNACFCSMRAMVTVPSISLPNSCGINVLLPKKHFSVGMEIVDLLGFSRQSLDVIISNFSLAFYIVVIRVYCVPNRFRIERKGGKARYKRSAGTISL